MGLFGTTDPRAVHSAWVFVIFGCVHTCLGESLATALVEVKFNSLTLAALSFNIAKDLLVFSIPPLSQSRAAEIEFSLNIAHRRIVLGCHPYGRFCHNNSKLFLLLYVDQRNVATAVLV